MAVTSFELVIPGSAVPKARPRRGAAGGVYTPERTRRAEDAIAWEARAPRVTFVGPVSIVLVFCESRPPEHQLGKVVDVAPCCSTIPRSSIFGPAVDVSRGARSAPFVRVSEAGS